MYLLDLCISVRPFVLSASSVSSSLLPHCFVTPLSLRRHIARLLTSTTHRMSVFDSTVQGGDAVWEGIRVYNGRIFHLDRHIKRLHDSAKAMAFADIPSADYIKCAIFRTLAANGMRDGVHIRLTLSRGEKTTSSMNPRFNVYGSTIIVLAEWKPVVGPATYDNTAGVKLVTVR